MVVAAQSVAGDLLRGEPLRRYAAASAKDMIVRQSGFIAGSLPAAVREFASASRRLEHLAVRPPAARPNG
jgi:hypothetical protein